jgi:dipeptidyl aminopeptidase/acylaminoacyl peptidase
MSGSAILARVAVLTLVIGGAGVAHAQTRPTIAQFLAPASPLELASARKADRVAWITYERGMRNVYTAAAPDFRPVRLTRFLDDDGTDLTDVTISDDGSTIVFVRGSAPNRAGWIANPSHYPDGAERAIWAVRVAGGAPWRVVEGGSPELSPDGRVVLYVKEGQIYRARLTPGVTRDSMDLGLKPFIKEWGRQSNPVWSPDGGKVAYVSDRDHHAFISVYDMRTRRVSYVAPGVDCDASPTWSSDGRQLAFLRKPGMPFGRQTQQGSGGIGNPAGPAAGRRGGGCASSFGGFSAQQPDSSRPQRPAGLYTSTLRGGYPVAIMVADVASGEARELWHPSASDSVFAAMNRIVWARDEIIFPLSPANDEWDRYYSVRVSSPAAEPVLLTTTNGLIEGATSASLSPDRRTLYYCTNAGDIERRHLWAVPTAGGTPVQLTKGEGIETWPLPLASGKQLATLTYGVRQPASVGLVSANGGSARVIFPTLGADFPAAAHVTPEIVITKAADGLEIHNQLFLPKDLKPGERRPAMVFVHGGPMRQMLPGYHYMQFYHWSYAYNQWLASQGYVVLSINYRSGIGYGRSFQRPANTNARGNSEYQDVVAGAKYLQSRADVDPSRVGIWGLSYGGLLTSQALARNSDIFVAGADLAGVHLYGSSLDTTAVSYRSSAISAIDTWKSPVYLVHGDDDRNVDFAQTVGLVQLLRAHGVHYELEVIPDDTHESLLHSRWIDTFGRIGDFLHRYVWEKRATADQ